MASTLSASGNRIAPGYSYDEALEPQVLDGDPHGYHEKGIYDIRISWYEKRLLPIPL
jgi:hypothetical protein